MGLRISPGCSHLELYVILKSLVTEVLHWKFLTGVCCFHVYGNQAINVYIQTRWSPLFLEKTMNQVVEVLYFDKSQVKVPNPGSLERLISYVLIYFRLLAGYGGAGILIVH